MKSFEKTGVAIDIEQNIHHPIVITSGNVEVSKDFKILCAKGPSFVPTPEYFDWLQLQKDFDAFRNRVRARYIFQNKEPYVRPKDQPPSKRSNWSAPKTSSSELETFLSSVERSLFQDCSRKIVSNNLTKEQRNAMKAWREEQLFNTEGDLVMRLQDKGNRFIVVDKNTDKLKANEQIERSSFVRLDHDPTLMHVE